MQGYLAGVSEGTRVLLILSVILFAGFIMTRLTNTLNLPKVSGYIMAGILIGPCGLNLIPVEIIGHMGFVSDLALAFIAFGVGKFFKKEVLLKTGSRIIIITLFEALLAGVLVTLFCVGVFKMEWNFALILGAIATATAPASTMMTINQYKAKGEFVNTLLQIVALDDVVCLLAFSIVAGIAGRTGNEELTMSTVLMPVVYNILALGLGFFCGYFLSRLLIPARSKDNRLILAIAMLLGISGICASLDISPLLSCMIFGASYINLTSDKKLYRQINNFTPPVMSIFFIMSGMNLDLSALTTVGTVGLAYFIVRIIGKYLGTYISCLITGTSREIRNYMGLALIPQAGVAIGLAFLGQRLLPEEMGKLLLTIILSSSVLYEMVGPVCAKMSLFLSGSITTEKMKEVAKEREDEIHEENLIASENEEHEEDDGSWEDGSEDGSEDESEDESDGERDTVGKLESDVNERGEMEEEDGNCNGDGRSSKDGIECSSKKSPKRKKEYGEEDNSKADLHKMTDQPSGDSNGKKTGNGKGRKNTETRKKKEMSDEELLQHELLEQIKELEAGVEDQEEDYDIEREIEPEKEKAPRKGKARKKKK
ncbi:cation:proton antiporter [Hungatella sp. L12]|uniref:Cation:proton antiporter n=1 Tax=Hungatella hominis TaxID=2763050 RepID=A0ABR7HF21_9FIRM|nr:cation:proton antiporter [Hungatella hominis]MBC5711791.1 cation:proton antiporter [Hungatella hominis]